MKKKILIGYATAGVGHKKAAMAVEDALKRGQYDLEIKDIDVLDYTNPLFKKMYPTVYLLLINKFIWLWGILYYLFDNRIVYKLLYPLRKFSHVVNSQKLVKFLVDYKPDVVVSTHFILPDVCAYVKKKFGLNIHVINIITDYRAHSFWISEGVDTYIAGHRFVKDELVNRWGIAEEKVKVLGIPVEPKFCAAHDKLSARKKLNIKEDSFTVLLLGGGYGVGPIFEMLESLNGANFPLTAITVCGHNESLFKKIESLAGKYRVQLVNLGYTNNVDELMAASDIYVGKAGGISTTEAANMGLPMVFIRALPGQEKANLKLFVGMGAAEKLKNPGELLKVVKDIKFSPDKLSDMRRNLESFKGINSAEKIAVLIEGIK